MGDEDAAFLSDYYVCADGNMKAVIHEIAKQKGGSRAVRRLVEVLKTGEYGTLSAAAPRNKELYPRLFVTG